MKTFRTVFSLLFLFILGAFLFIWIEREIEERNERAERPLPTGLHPIVESKRDQLIAQAEEVEIDILITDGFRSVEEQNEIHAQGRTRGGSVVTYAEGGESYHNYGLAIDFALRLPDGSVVWDIQHDGNGNGRPDWFEVADIAKGLGFEWGGDWMGFKDYPHLQLDFGLSIRQLQDGYRPEDVISD
ncbi:M15 family metallopeptidase [Planococcus sp. CP5-4]|uniref:M15 family metallopeptidase n=1 Tax=unclassified Planococcus (in: firmicutes) TaxID=2662419 RepID=UPI001C23579F|nr:MULTISPECIES: M15 family metallopeptidase [unclassified Planococcus (in: firmicutes)]MBU9672386.1 M15 family metallopeptidase [Planococcus sp. CP5-4_YE]MBV0909437.1 M15 family metallopeptidase [Planococcus sp. CP5-4_UN]MBW6064166.1 M15 family metallopeptidase [Planococcus sp. CP5-4]